MIEIQVFHMKGTTYVLIKKGSQERFYARVTTATVARISMLVFTARIKSRAFTTTVNPFVTGPIGWTATIQKVANA